MKYTHKAPFDKGYNGMVSAVEHPEMMGMEFGVVKMAAGDVMHFDYAQEVVYDLMSGSVTFAWNGNSETVTRKDVFHEGAILLHVPQNTRVTISAESDAEIAVSRTENKRDFAARLLRPEDCLCANEERGAGQMNECSTRLVRTFFDRSNCPETNFFIGEVVHFPGKWSSYPPHHHPQPECYFYRFDKPMGFGAGWGNGEIYETHHNGLAIITDKMHSQVTAPGYSCCYAWGIRHLPGNPWDKTRIDDEEHLWLLEDDANDHIWHCPSGN